MPADAGRVKEIFVAALGKPDPAERAAFLAALCGPDTPLRERVEELLRASEDPAAFLDEHDPLLPLAAALPTQGQPAPAGTAAGRLLGGRYKLLQEIAEGGMGSVWMAEQTEPVKRLVAVKLIKPGMDSKGVLARFEAERQALALMDHAHIAKVFDGGTTAEGRPYFVMELVKGVPLTDYCDQRQLSVRQRLELFIPVCSAVQHAHQKGIIHRDLKPSNVLVTEHDGVPVPKVIDFGLAKAVHGPQALTEHTLYTAFGAAVGTPLYMAPEQVGINALDVDTRTDVYALGVLLYELLTGSTPLEKRRLKEAAWEEIRRLIREEEPPKPSTRLSSSEALPTIAARRHAEPGQLGKQVQGELDWIVMKCLEKDRGRRYDTVTALARDVERYLKDEAVEACPPSAAYRLRKLARRYRTPLRLAAACLLLLLAGVAVSALQAVRATRAEAGALAARDAEAQERQEAEQQRDRAVTAEGLAQMRLQEIASEKQRADDEAAVAKAVNEFLQKDLLGQADIGNQTGGGERNPKITVRELLDRASQQVGSKFPGQERTEAAIRVTLGNAYRELGEYAEAQKHLERALALWKQQKGAEHAETLGAMEALGQLYTERGQFGEAEALLRPALAGFRLALGPDHHCTLVCMNNLAVLNKERGQFGEAEMLYKQALAGFRREPVPDHRNTLACMRNLAQLYKHQGQYDDAEQNCKQLLEDARSRLGADHPVTLDAMDLLATLAYLRGRYDEAEVLTKQVVVRKRAKLGLDHPQTLISMSNLATLYHTRKRYDEAEVLFKQVVERKQTKLGPDHPQTLTSMNNLAALYRDCGRYDEAESVEKEVLERSRTKLGPDHPLTLTSMGNLAIIYQDRGRLEEAEPLHKQALELDRAKLGAVHPDTLVSMNNLACLYRDRGRYAEAESLFQEALAGARKTDGPRHAQSLLILPNLAHLYEVEGQPGRAEPLRRELVALEREQAGSDPLAHARRLAELAANLLQQKRFAEVEAPAREALAIRAKKAPDLWTTFNTRAQLGAALLGQKQYAQAEPLLLQGYEGMKQRLASIPTEGKVRLREALERLVQLYEATGKKGDTAKWRQELDRVRASAKTGAKP
jgi:tetratricopeptide (TPR) repeat protein